MVGPKNYYLQKVKKSSKTTDVMILKNQESYMPAESFYVTEIEHLRA